MTNREPGRRDDYRLDVEHFGPIQRASVDVRPFTVFIGPSNTGKSYLAVLIYALHRSLNMDYGWMPRTTTPDDELLRDLRSWAQEVHSERPVPSPPPNVADHIDAVLKNAKWLESTFTDELRRCFGVDSLDALARRPGADVGARIRFPGAADRSPDTARYEFRFGSGDHGLSGQVSPVSPRLPDAARLKEMVLESTTLMPFDDDTIEEDFDTSSLFRLVGRGSGRG